ncbi:MAG: asparagine synthase (glutamine-hydrolyzing) [Gammaproteobacteria bacterium]|jgi:asparagine synthase (glutamine-hydrolysing)|nr:asparagine synthase (glutamine-hydrolyzing) [Gammaproteobacteria bacterium]
MCGFVGGTDPSWNYAAALAAIAHRGPDDGRLNQQGPVHVGFRRLAIIDLDPAANQPMLAADGAGWIVFNGEIYGFAELRRELEKRGRHFRTHSDTEVILNAYAEWGDAFVEHIDGMFAIAIWDAREARLKLFRDRPGIKPLYYYFDGRRLAFASELKALEHALDPADLQVDTTALYDFLSYRYVPAPKTAYKNCFKLPPAHKLVFNPATGAISAPQPYWSLPAVAEPAVAVGADAAAEELRALIDGSVKEQMVADVPLGFFLSGGVDSSAVVASASRSGAVLDTFSIGFDSDKSSETPFAREVAELFHTRHHERILSRAEAGDLLANLRGWFDEPFADESALPTYLVSRVARENVTVVLTGDGGDEVFGGYRTYPRFQRYDGGLSWPQWMNTAMFRARRPFGRRSSVTRITNLLEMRFTSGPELWGRIMAGMPAAAKEDYRVRFGIPNDYDDWWHYRQHWRADLPVRTRLQYLDFHTFLPGLVLTKVDRTSMAVSLEARVPLLDRRIIEYSFSLPEAVRYYNGELKGLLKHAYRGLLPDHILHRRKKGFGIPRSYLQGVDGDRFIQAYLLDTVFAHLNG